MARHEILSDEEKAKMFTRSQDRVLRYLKEFGSITSLEAISELGETRISARIFELKDKGVVIDSDWVEVENRWHEKRRVKRYLLVA